jgi:hypothetical protein
MNAPESESDQCKCPRCSDAAPFGEWAFLDGITDGFWCEDCNDFHSCFECPSCGAFVGAAGHYVGRIEVVS